MTAPGILRDFQPEVGLVLGSGWDSLAQHLEEPICVTYDSVPGLPVTRVPGHAGKFLAGWLGGRRVIAACGRVHLYEGWSAREAAAHVRLIAETGVRVLLVCNAAGAVNPAFEPGTWMLICDHLNLTAQSPLTGSPAFLDMRDAYSPRLRALARAVDPALEEGVYAGLPGPHYETPAEIRHAVPTIGQHTDEILGEKGFSAKEISELKAAGVVGPQ